MKSTLIIICSLFLLNSCSKRTIPKVVDGWQNAPSSTFYQVKPNDTLYSIAWNFNLNEKDLAKINNLVPPYHLKTGDKIRLNKSNSSKSTLSKTIANKNDTNNHPTNNLKWLWPTTALLKHKFHQPDSYQKGLDFTGKIGEPIYATQTGTVVYQGTGLTAYGKLIIIKHQNDYLSAYGHLKEFKVKEGDKIKKGKIIGSMGIKNNLPFLHFEIRHFGNPINPEKLLNQKITNTN